MTILNAGGFRLAAAFLVTGGFLSSAFGSAFGVGAFAGPGGAGSTGCSNQATYNGNSGGSYQVLSSGFDNNLYLGSSCSLSGSVSATALGATSIATQVAESALGETSPGVYTSPTSAMASGAANLADGTFHIFANSTAPNTLVGMQNTSGGSMWDTITINRPGGDSNADCPDANVDGYRTAFATFQKVLGADAWLTKDAAQRLARVTGSPHMSAGIQ